MIYIFDCVKGICQLPGRACELCGEGCKLINCRPITDCCNAISQSCTGFTEKPLCSFVMISYLMVGTQLAFAFQGLGVASLPDCDFPQNAWVGPTAWLLGQISFAALGLLFAPYFQNKVWENIKERVVSTPPPLDPKGGKAKIPKKVIQESFKQVFLEDFGVLFYFIALFGQLAWSWKGEAWIAADPIDCHDAGFIGYSAGMGQLFFFVTMLYTTCWYCCECCAGSVNAPNAEGNYMTVDLEYK